MPSAPPPQAPANCATNNTDVSYSSLALPILLTVFGMLLRLANAWYRFLNPDEALHYLLSVQTSLGAAYRASLTTVHPPLLIAWLYFWRRLGHSELLLRLPMVIAGTLFCWVMFCWLRRVTNASTALTGLALFLFSPSLVQLSSEVRQYPFLLLFCALSLNCLECSFQGKSVLNLVCSALALYLALLTHYSSLLFAVILGFYALLRFVRGGFRARFLALWILLQMGGIVIAAILYRTHVSKIRASGGEEFLMNSYLTQSVPHPGQNWWWFAAHSNLRLFHYLFSQAVAGVAGLILFVAGVFLISRRKELAKVTRHPSGMQLAFLLSFPLALNFVLSLWHIYPYGGTRHNSYLSIFAFSSIAIAIATWKPRHGWWKAAVLIFVLAYCNLFPVPMDQYIRLRDQSRKQMAIATRDLRASPPNSIIFTDDQGGLLLSFYLCGNKVVQIEQQPFQPFMRAACGNLSVISIDPDLWIFKADTFPSMVHSVAATYSLPPQARLLFFQAGWFIDKEYELRDELKHYGCAEPGMFGRNILICPIAVQ